MKLLTQVDRDTLSDATCVAESNEFAVYALGSETFALVHRHEGTEWEGITISGDGVFRVTALLTDVTRQLYRDMARNLSEAQHR